jgi:hypothetical protein
MMVDGLLSYFSKFICDFEGFFFKSVPETSVNPSLGFRSLVVMKLVKKFGIFLYSGLEDPSFLSEPFIK